MSKARLVITAVVIEGRSQGEVARSYGVSQGWISRLVVRYRTEGEDAFEPRSRRPKTSPGAISSDTVDLIIRLRKELTGQGLDAGPHTICWHLQHHHGIVVSAATVSRHLARQGLVTPDPKKRPRSSYLRFEAGQPNECWQSDFTHYRLTRPGGSPGADTEIICWLDDHSRYVLHLAAHARVTGPIALGSFRAACARHGVPASTLTDNGTVYTARFVGGRNGLEHELRRLKVRQKNGKPNHPPDPGQDRAVLADPEEMARSAAQPATHPRPAPGPAGHLHHPLQHRPAAPLPATPPDTRHRLRRPAQSRPRHRRPGQPRPRPQRPRRRRRQAHPPPRRPPLPHRHRPDPTPEPAS
jgi:transposase